MNKELKDIIENSENAVFFGGAGVSTESGIPDFRSVDGIYNLKYDYPPEKMCSHSFFSMHTAEFYRFYKDRMIYPNARPNMAHIKLAELEKQGRINAVVTQNIDGLHQVAGSKNVYELHGSVHRNYCLDCGKRFGLEYILSSDGIPLCDTCGETVRPDVVLYEEQLDSDTVIKSIEAIENADTLIIGGTSLGVYPAAGLIRYFKGENVILINKTPTEYDRMATLIIRDPIAEVFSML